MLIFGSTKAVDYMRLVMIILAGLQGLFSWAPASAQESTATPEALQKCQLPDELSKARAQAVAETEAARQAAGTASPDFAKASQALGRALYAAANVHRTRGCFAEASSSLDDMLALMKPQLPPTHPLLLRIYTERAGLAVEVGRLAEAEAEFKQVLAALADSSDAQSLSLKARAENDTAELFLRRNEFDAAEAGFRRALAINENVLPADAVDIAKNLNNLAEVHARLGHYHNAEPLFARALPILEAKLGLEHPDVATVLNNLATLNRSQGQLDKALPLFQRALEVRRKKLDPGHPDVAQSYNNLGWIYQNLGERARDAGRTEEARSYFANAERQFTEALGVLERALGKSHSRVGSIRNNLAVVQFDQQRYAEAEPLFREAIAIREAQLGPDHADVAQSRHRMARLYHAQGRYRLALSLHRKALYGRLAALGAEHPDVVQSLDDLAETSGALSRWRQAIDYSRQARDIVVDRARRGVRIGDFAADDRGRQEIASRRDLLDRHVRRLWSLAGSAPAQLDALREEAFDTAHWASQTAAEAAIAQMALRQAKGSGALADLIRERQDLVRQWQALDQQLQSALASATASRSQGTEREWQQRMAALDTRRTLIDQRLQVEAPEFARLSQPEPLSAVEARGLLRSDEALVQFMVTHKETFVFAVSSAGALWRRVDLGAQALAKEVDGLRCGLDETAWSGDTCAALTGRTFTEDDSRSGRFLPFDHARAHRLYRSLFADIEGAVKGKALLIVPSGALSRLPFHVLITQLPDLARPQQIAWLARRYAVTVLPAASSLKSLRRTSRPSAATRPMIGFGNPLLDGDPSTSTRAVHERRQAELARVLQGCATISAERTPEWRRARRSAAPLEQKLGVVDLAHLRIQSPLPETADELCAVARDLNADLDEIRLGARATEREIKALSTSGRLADYRVLHFATHGVLAGQIDGSREPGLVFTPPATATDEDDGYLSASEIAGLRLDADWVILSACNTAGGAGGEAGSEALSGLARVFFYAGARALLVSHWAVDSAATVKLVTMAVGTMTQQRRVGRAEALRRAMLTMIENGSPREMHPAAWAPFVVVGEGALGSQR